jgi:outer membrane lipoprotein SlyB
MCRKIISMIVVLTFTIGLVSCATIPEEHRGAATGAGIGAVAGATAGALLGAHGAKTEMAVLGGLLGALAGGLIGHYAYDKKKSEKETAQQYNYQPSQGVMARIENAEAVPKTVSQGETVDMRMTYALLGIGGERNVTETREIRYEGELYGKPQVTVTHGEGTFVSTIPLTLPSDAPEGKYEIIMTIQASNVSDSRGTSFYVE